MWGHAQFPQLAPAEPEAVATLDTCPLTQGVWLLRGLTLECCLFTCPGTHPLCGPCLWEGSRAGLPQPRLGSCPPVTSPGQIRLPICTKKR